MARLSVTVAFGLLVASCSARQRPPELPPLQDEAEVYLYAMPFPREADNLTFRVEGISAELASGPPQALQVATGTVDGRAMRHQRLLAWGRIAPGRYQGFLVRVSAAKLVGDEGTSDLLVPAEPVRIPIGFAADRRTATVVSLTFRPHESIEQGFGFHPVFGAVTPPRTPPQRAGFCSNTALHNLTVFERGTYLVTGAVPTGLAPRGLALDPLAGRAYVALSGEDQIDVIDLGTAGARRRIRLVGGDEPREVVLSPDRSQLLSLNARSRTVSFVDASSLVELARVEVGQEPSALLADRAGRRAYVFNRKSNSISALDLANRALALTVPTDAEPLNGALSRDGTRLYAIFAGSSYMSLYTLPGLTLSSRVFVGLGATAILADPRTDLVYVAKGAEGRIAAYDAFSTLAVDDFEVEGPVTWMTIDDAENALLALAPSRRSVTVIDLTSRRIRAVMDVGAGPFQVKVAGER